MVNLVGRTVNCIKTPDHQDVIVIDLIQSDRAWPVGVVPFQMSDIAPRGFPRVPWLSRFLELNASCQISKNTMGEPCHFDFTEVPSPPKNPKSQIRRRPGARRRLSVA